MVLSTCWVLQCAVFLEITFDLLLFSDVSVGASFLPSHHRHVETPLHTLDLVLEEDTELGLGVQKSNLVSAHQTPEL